MAIFVTFMIRAKYIWPCNGFKPFKILFYKENTLLNIYM